MLYFSRYTPSITPLRISRHRRRLWCRSPRYVSMKNRSCPIFLALQSFYIGGTSADSFLSLDDQDIVGNGITVAKLFPLVSQHAACLPGNRFNKSHMYLSCSVILSFRALRALHPERAQICGNLSENSQNLQHGSSVRRLPSPQSRT